MKNMLLLVLMLVAASLLVSHVARAGLFDRFIGDSRQTEGTLSFTVRTVTYNGQYAPRNSGAIWITNAQNQFVKTIKVWAQPYRYTLIRWNASSGGNTTGAITGASLNNHILHTVSWNGANYQGTQVPDGVYNVNVEFTEHNATASNMGKYKQISFTKGQDAVDLTIPNESYFRDMTLVWEPVVVNGIIMGTVSTGSGVPVAGALVQTGAYSVTTNASGAYELSLPPGIYDLACIAGGYDNQSANGVVVESGFVTQQDFVLNAVENSDEYDTPGVLTIHGARPNPFRGHTSFEFETRSAQPVFIEVFNQRGQMILRDDLAGLAKGLNSYVWNGQDNEGRRCPPGMYLIRVRQNGMMRLAKMQLLD